MFHHLLLKQSEHQPDAIALSFKGVEKTYTEVLHESYRVAGALYRTGLRRFQRVAIYLPKQFETVTALFATSLAGGVFVPVNPQLKPAQVGHILMDCEASVLITSSDRLARLEKHPEWLSTVQHIITTDKLSEPHSFWPALSGSKLPTYPSTLHDMAALLYTSGSTGKPKGVIISHQNLVVGAESVAQYLGLKNDDRLLAALPFSFDYGLNQLSSAFFAGASVSLINYLFPADIIKALDREPITGLAGVPPLWIQLANLSWPEPIRHKLRFITNSGGHMPLSTLQSLRSKLPNTRPYLMYGLTEAFRSTYLDPDELDRRPDSIGKAIPNAEVLLLNEDGTPCKPGETGELVHRGPLVSLGYWNDIERTRERFRPLPREISAMPLGEIAVWSGDWAKQDEEGFFYFVGRRDDMIKTSGFRVSPTEIEEYSLQHEGVMECVAFGVPHPILGQAIVLLFKGDSTKEALAEHLKSALPSYMHPLHLEKVDALPRNNNGKFDRSLLKQRYQDLFKDCQP